MAGTASRRGRQGGSPAWHAKATRVVIGGGHNGLVAAAYLARSGAKTLVLEARPTVSGAATTESPWPDAPQFKVTRLSYVMSLLPPTILNDLKLKQHGYKVFPMGPYYRAFPEGGLLVPADAGPVRNASVTAGTAGSALAAIMPRIPNSLASPQR